MTKIKSSHAGVETRSAARLLLRAARPDPTLPCAMAVLLTMLRLPTQVSRYRTRQGCRWGNGNLEAAGRPGSGDILVADSYYCTYWLLAECRRRGVPVVMRNHHLRDDSPSDSRRLVKGQCVATWVRPPRPEWMDEATYSMMPPTIDVRLVESVNEQAGQRTQKITIATTLLDHKQYDAQWLAGIYRGRWRVELDIRAIKVTLGMEILRAKTPAMVAQRTVVVLVGLQSHPRVNAACRHRKGRPCRSLSLTATLQMDRQPVAANAMHEVNARLPALFRTHQVKLKVGNRPGRNEPRVNKRRPKMLKLMTEPRPKKLAAAAA